MPCPAPFVGWESLHPRRRASAGEATTGAAARRSGFRHTNFQTGDRADVKSANDAVTSRAYAPWRRIAQAIGIRPDESEALISIDSDACRRRSWKTDPDCEGKTRAH